MEPEPNWSEFAAHSSGLLIGGGALAAVQYSAPTFKGRNTLKA